MFFQKDEEKGTKKLKKSKNKNDPIQFKNKEEEEGEGIIYKDMSKGQKNLYSIYCKEGKKIKRILFFDGKVKRGPFSTPLPFLLDPQNKAKKLKMKKK